MIYFELVNIPETLPDGLPPSHWGIYHLPPGTGRQVSVPIGSAIPWNIVAPEGCETDRLGVFYGSGAGTVPLPPGSEVNFGIRLPATLEDGATYLIDARQGTLEIIPPVTVSWFRKNWPLLAVGGAVVTGLVALSKIRKR